MKNIDVDRMARVENAVETGSEQDTKPPEKVKATTVDVTGTSYILAKTNRLTWVASAGPTTLATQADLKKCTAFARVGCRGWPKHNDCK